MIVTIQHPAHVHLFRHAIAELERDGHEVHVLAREKGIALRLLDHYDVDHTVLARPAASLRELAVRQAQYEVGMLRHARRIDPDVMVGVGEPGVAHVSSLLGCTGIVFTDTEHATLQNALTFPFADVVCTPSCYRDDVGAKQIRYPGYHELAYLHPNRFAPRPDVFDDIWLSRDDSFVILRMSAWRAAHDIGDSGIEEVTDVIRRLEDAGAEVVVTSEPDLPPALDRHAADVPIHRMHDLLSYADLFVGEGATMAAESAVLGTPAIFVSTSRRGYTDELGDRYGLVSTFSGADRQEAAVARAEAILEDDDATWRERRQQLLTDKIDTNEFVVEQLTGGGGDA